MLNRSTLTQAQISTFYCNNVALLRGSNIEGLTLSVPLSTRRLALHGSSFRDPARFDATADILHAIRALYLWDRL